MAPSWHGVECGFRAWSPAAGPHEGLHSAPYAYLLRRGRLCLIGAGPDAVLAGDAVAWWPSATPLQLQALDEPTTGWILRFRRSAFAPQIQPDAEALVLCARLERYTLGHGPILPLRRSSRQALRDLAASLEPIWLGSGRDRALRLKGGGCQWLALLAADPKLQDALAALPAAGADQRIEALLSWLDVHYTEELDLTTLADRVGLARSRFCQVFRAHTGRSPQEHLRRLRIAQACRLLRERDWDVTRIGLAVGFGSMARFHATFKAILHSAPGRWRRSL